MDPSHIVIVFDSSSSRDSRLAIFDGYKGNRSEAPAGLQQQFRAIRRLCHSLGISTLSEDGVEADDVIATLVQRACKESLSALSLSSSHRERLREEEEEEEERAEIYDRERLTGGIEKSYANDGLKGEREHGISTEQKDKEEDLRVRKGEKEEEKRKKKEKEGERKKKKTNSPWSEKRENEEREFFEEVIVVTSDKDLLQVLQHNYMTAPPSLRDAPSSLEPSSSSFEYNPSMHQSLPYPYQRSLLNESFLSSSKKRDRHMTQQEKSKEEEEEKEEKKKKKRKTPQIKKKKKTSNKNGIPNTHEDEEEEEEREELRAQILPASSSSHREGESMKPLSSSFFNFSPRPKVWVMQLHRKLTLVDERWVYLHYGVHAHQLRDYLALVGDAVDGIEGCHGIGPKTAIKLLAHANPNKNLTEVLGDKRALSALVHPHQVESLFNFRSLFERNRQLIALDSHVASLNRFPLSQFSVVQKKRPRPLSSYQREKAPSISSPSRPLSSSSSSFHSFAHAKKDRGEKMKQTERPEEEEKEKKKKNHALFFFPLSSCLSSSSSSFPRCYTPFSSSYALKTRSASRKSYPFIKGEERREREGERDRKKEIPKKT
ncbi:5 -3 n-terminal resolvase family domain-containing protein [Cystoisospora suis]|uniref:5-3 n-terminal resolvase family domain-containing protein n=1 Tax=Cystoisospora suis TaxID=483139 RepID=A0A2C6KIA0_9APIC|nr:5 -3 n-terminal resolvase family domain-containing protein [Cystoisospora suis]